MIKINPYSLYNSLLFKGTDAEKPDEIKVFHTDDYKTFDTVVVKKYPSVLGFPYLKAYKGYTNQDIAKTPAKKVELNQRKGMSIEYFDKNQNIIRFLSVNEGHDISKNTAVLEMWDAPSNGSPSSTVWIKIPIGEKFVKPRAELIEDGKRTARIVLNEKGENIASERSEYKDEDMEKLYAAIKRLLDEAKKENIKFPYDAARKWFNV